MKESEILNILKKTEALLTGHFKLSSGLHSNQYIQYALALQYPEYAAKFGKAVADEFRNRGIDCVAGPAIGGIIIAHEVAKALNVRCIFGERNSNGEMALHRFDLKPKERVLIVEDVITTGKSIRELIEVIRKRDAVVVAIGALAERSSKNIDFGCETRSLIKLNMETFNPDECPLCKDNIPIIKPGSRK